MSLLTIDTQKEHDRYQARDANTRVAIDAAYTAARKALQESSIEVANDDRAEELIAAISYYVRRSSAM